MQSIYPCVNQRPQKEQSFLRKDFINEVFISLTQSEAQCFVRGALPTIASSPLDQPMDTKPYVTLPFCLHHLCHCLSPHPLSSTSHLQHLHFPLPALPIFSWPLINVSSVWRWEYTTYDVFPSLVKPTLVSSLKLTVNPICWHHCPFVY